MPPEKTVGSETYPTISNYGYIRSIIKPGNKISKASYEYNPTWPTMGQRCQASRIVGLTSAEEFFGEDREWGLPEASDTYGQRGSQTKPVVDWTLHEFIYNQNNIRFHNWLGHSVILNHT